MSKFLEYPRTLFRGEATCVVANADEKAAKLAAGWVTKPLPGEAVGERMMGDPETGIGITLAPSFETPVRRRGRPPKVVTES